LSGIWSNSELSSSSTDVMWSSFSCVGIGR
jgi:hypothetical protein